MYFYATAQFRLYTCVLVHLCASMFTACYCKVKDLMYICTVACNFVVRMIASEYMRHVSDACHELILDFHTTYVVYTFSKYV